MTRSEQIQVMEQVVIPTLEKEIDQGRDTINRVLYVTRDRRIRFETLP